MRTEIDSIHDIPIIAESNVHRSVYWPVTLHAAEAIDTVLAIVQDTLPMRDFQGDFMLTLHRGGLSVDTTYQDLNREVRIELDRNATRALIETLTDSDSDYTLDECSDIITDYQLLGRFQSGWKSLVHGPLVVQRCPEKLEDEKSVQLWVEVTDHYQSGGLKKPIKKTTDQGMEIMTAEWDSARSYTKGEVVIHNGKLYGAACDIPAGSSSPGTLSPQTSSDAVEDGPES